MADTMALILIAVAVVGLVALCLFTYIAFRDREVFPAEECAYKLYEATSGIPVDLPDKFRGVFWMSDNLAWELMCSLEGSTFNAEQRYIKIHASDDFTWTYDTCLTGVLYWYFCKVADLFGSTFYLYFSDDSFTHCSMYLYAFDRIRVPLGMTWTMTQADVKGEEGQGNTWRRSIFLFSSEENQTASYTLRKVLDKDGKKLPAFDEMIKSLVKYDKDGNVMEAGVPVKDSWTKSHLQIMNVGSARSALMQQRQDQVLLDK